MEFLAFLMLFASSAVIAEAADRPLCVNGHPVKRPPVHYAGLKTCIGHERDHIVPICLGGPDVRSNLQYQPWPQALAKDDVERATCESYCRGQITLEVARANPAFVRTYGLVCPE